MTEKMEEDDLLAYDEEEKVYQQLAAVTDTEARNLLVEDAKAMDITEEVSGAAGMGCKSTEPPKQSQEKEKLDTSAGTVDNPPKNNKEGEWTTVTYKKKPQKPRSMSAPRPQPQKIPGFKARYEDEFTGVWIRYELLTILAMLLHGTKIRI